MSLTVRLPPRIEQALATYCATHRVTKSEAVKQALDRLLSKRSGQASPYELGIGGFGADDSPRADVARHTKRLIKERFGGKARS